ncbi:MAG: glutathione S-transferase family protein [Rhodospirillaceae bacterium]
MITLCQFTTAPVWGINPSPFCMKVESYLRLAGLPFRTLATMPFKAPKGKLPFIIEPDGQRIPDSGQIIAHLEATRGGRLDGGLTADQRALGHLIRRTCEESLFFVTLYSRWFDEPGWSILRPLFFGRMAPPMRWIVPALVRRGLRRDLLGQGTLRHGRDEIYALGCADLDALAAILGDRPFFLTDRPTSVDAGVHAFMASIVKPPIETPLKAHAAGHGALGAFVARMDARLAAAG